MNERTMTSAGLAIPALMRATLFAAEKHRGQRRKDASRTPYINHPIMVVNLLSNVGRITDLETLQASTYLGGSGEPQLVNGVEKHFVINHLGHFILVNRLLARLYVSWQGRVVTVASRAAYRDAPAEGILFDDLAMSRNYSDARAYGHSKLANVLFSLKLAELLRGTRMTSNSLHPGVIATELSRNLNALSRFAWNAYVAVAGKTAEEGAATTCYVATSETLGNVSGQFFEEFPQNHLMAVVVEEQRERAAPAPGTQYGDSFRSELAFSGGHDQKILFSVPSFSLRIFDLCL